MWPSRAAQGHQQLWLCRSRPEPNPPPLLRDYQPKFFFGGRFLLGASKHFSEILISDG